MKSIRLRWALVPSFIFLVVISIVPLTWYMSAKLRTFHVEQTKASLETSARLIANAVSRVGVNDDINRLCREFAESTSVRITIVDPRGRVLGDSVEDLRLMDNHGRRPEIMAAMQGTVGVSIRSSETLGRNLMYVGVPLMEEKRVVGVVRVSLPLAEVDEAIGVLKKEISLAGLLIAGVALVLGLLVASGVSRPLEMLKSAADRFAGGDMQTIPPGGAIAETMALTSAMNKMAEELDSRMRSIILERNERDAVFKGMIEGVLVVDNDECVKHINDAARKLLSGDIKQVEGRPLQEVVRNLELQALLAQALRKSNPIDTCVKIRGENGLKDTFVQCRAAPLLGGQSRREGVIVVLSDVTGMRRLEQMRRDFVANVSHELKTPVTSIKGFSETLLDGAAEDPVDLKRFLHKIIKHADHLSALIDDLMILSRLEHDSDADRITLEENSLASVLREAVDVCAALAAEKQIKIEINCPPGLKARFNAALFCQAVVNLVDNAVKYSPAGRPVKIGVKEDAGFIRIDIVDRGVGVERKHLDRLFERFYRVDKSRSRNLGGTGLGLSIVKHVVIAHGGTLSVDSVVGQGTTFTIRLPVRP